MTERILGPTGGRRRRWLFVPFGLVIAAGLVFAITASANLSGSLFEGNDANLVVNTAGNKDWDNAPNLEARQDLPVGVNDNSFGEGSKEDDLNVTVGGGSIPNSKANLARFAVAGETVSGQTFLYLAWSREDASGTVNFDFEINAAEQPDLVTFGAKTLVRTVNDLLINYSFSGGSTTNVALTVRKWNGTSWGTETPISSDCSEGKVNTSTVSDTLGGLAPVDRTSGLFGEASINLVCAGVIPPNSCAPFSSAYVKSRSAVAFNSAVKDFIAPVSVGITACGSITIKKHTAPRDLDQSFSYTTTGAGLSGFSLNDVGAGDTASNTKVFSGLQPGARTVTEGSPDPAGFAFNNVSCTGGGANTTTSGRVATIGLDAGEDIVCTYVNDQVLGAIKLTKRSVKQVGGVGVPLAGAVFTIGTTDTAATGADGTVCVDGLAFGTYAVKEKTAPTGFVIDDTTTTNIVVDTNAKCSDSPYVGESKTYTDTPLTDILVKATSQAATGGTASRITCTGPSPGTGNIGNSPQPSATTFGNPAQVDANGANGVKPGTYVCTIIVDP